MIQYDFSGETFIVTGATKGIGRSIATALLQAGAQVSITYSHDESAAKETDRRLKEAGLSTYSIIRSDVSKRGDVEALFNVAEAAWGQPVSGIVNNAGILKQGNFLELEDAQWDRTFQVNLKGPFMLCQEYLRRKPKNGRIVNISSVGGQTGGDKAPDYAASKAGLISLTRSMARLGSSIGLRVNAVAPGWIKTEIFTQQRLAELEEEAKEKILLGRMGSCDEVASAVMFLLSQESSYITGQCINVNGGMYFG